MSVLIDSNVLLRTAQVGHPQHDHARTALRVLYRAKHPLCIVPQVIVEFWVVATRPRSENGLGLTIQRTRAHLQEVRQGLMLLEELPGTIDQWQALVVAHQVRGKKAHDARLIASMMMHGLTDLLTFNTGDFSRYNQIRVMSPSAILG